MSNHLLRKDCSIALVGSIHNQIVGAKLSSNRQVLKVFFYNLRIVKLTVKESAVLVVQEVAVFWQKARIPTQRNDHCADKLIKLYEEWKLLQKSLNRNEGKAKEDRDSFEGIWDDLFDIAHSAALTKMKSEEDKTFLLLQRQKGRPGAMLGVDLNLKRKEERAQKRTLDEAKRRKRAFDEMQQLTETQNSNAVYSCDSADSDNQSPTLFNRVPFLPSLMAYKSPVPPFCSHFIPLSPVPSSHLSLVKQPANKQHATSNV